MAQRMPTRKLSSNALEIMPVRVGPPEQPTSPAKARRANRAVPPFRRAAEALLKVPGHMIPTESPHTEQPMSPTMGDGIREMHR